MNINDCKCTKHDCGCLNLKTSHTCKYHEVDTNDESYEENQ